MAIAEHGAELPESFDSLELTGPERRAARMFLDLAAEVAPDVKVLGPRRTQSRDLKVMLEFPEGPTWQMTKDLAGVSNEVRKRYGVYFILD